MKHWHIVKQSAGGKMGRARGGRYLIKEHSHRGAVRLHQHYGNTSATYSLAAAVDAEVAHRHRVKFAYALWQIETGDRLKIKKALRRIGRRW